MLQVIARGSNLERLGYVPWRRLAITLRDLAVSTWSITITPHPNVVDKLVPGNGVIVLRDGEQILSGPVEDDGPRIRSADDEESTGPGLLTVGGGSDLAIVAGELAIPDPTQPINMQTAVAYDMRSGAAETVIKGYVGDNVGVGRPIWRNDVTGQRLVTIAADQLRGTTVSYSARFDPLMDIIRRISEVGGGLRPRVTQSGTDLVFDVYEPVDRSGSVRFAWDIGNLHEVSWTRSAPTTTHVVVAGQGEGTARTFVERKDIPAAEQWRIVTRTFVDQRQTGDTAELEEAGDEALAEGGREGVLSATAVETAKVRFGRDFGLGDQVRVEPELDVSFVDVVDEVRIEADADSGRENVHITLGTPQGDERLPEVYRIVDQLARRIVALERRR